ncbi:MAG: putative Na+/melibiose symporter-like transporter [Promethearchaeota archaeon]|nr:MAG: putative Na+/melibiose symporter-like transporter [Candidatus Lokiarchaeota archaeon]
MSEKQDFKHSKLEMASYGAGPALNQFFRMAYVSLVFYFYESEIGLNTWLVGIAYIIFAIWNAINDPLVGFLTDRPFKFTKKWGRRFPWTMMAGIPWVFSYILIYAIPPVNPVSGALIIFIWLIFSTCLFDTFNSIWWVNFYSVFPDKFSDLNERRTASGIITPIGVIGIALGGILPPLLITYGYSFSYIIQAIVISFIGLIILFLGIPGWRDDPKSVQKYLETYEEQKSELSFFKTLKEAFKQRAFVVYIIIYFCFQVLIFSIQSSIPYFVRFVLLKSENIQLFMQVAFLIGALASIPFWIKLVKKTKNNKFVYLISATFLAAFSLPLSFLTNIFLILGLIVIWGVFLGGLWIMERPILSDVVDESVILTKKRKEATYVSIIMFFNRLAIIVQVFIFVIVHSLTGFVEGAATQPELAQIGIRLHFGLIPMIFLAIGALIFWRYYDLTPKRVDEVQYELRELKI